MYCYVTWDNNANPQDLYQAKENFQQEPARMKYYAERISLKEYQRQKIDYTSDQINLLYDSKEFNEMMNKKGTSKDSWNWQTRAMKKGLQRQINTQIYKVK
ncbi:UNKNOWN [Stylonychia lemnae]|uniref:Uncharacterized protein n=1 Tax=Stylonychia lemnae TaxID=5949 RepID=A0A077ZVU5_STYLE|nr:UNKNOWN [Stylonychia lemnae]|eukprot:CDW73370.1 UNKNOWN [Stylonychia lemnae]